LKFHIRTAIDHDGVRVAALREHGANSHVLAAAARYAIPLLAAVGIGIDVEAFG
jgi:hypothetical protein